MNETLEESVEHPLAVEADILRARMSVRERTRALGFGIVKQTKVVTAVSELARNALVYGGGGTFSMATVKTGRQVGVDIVIQDQGPGIEDLELALQDHFSSGTGMGLGLGGARRLVDDFHLESTPGVGTRVALRMWR